MCPPRKCFGRVIRLVREHGVFLVVLLWHALRYPVLAVVRSHASSVMKEWRNVRVHPQYVFCARVTLVKPRIVLDSKSHSELDCKHVVFSRVTDPHAHRVIRVRDFVPSFSTFCARGFPVGCVGKVPRSVQHLSNFEKNLNHMLVAVHLRAHNRVERQEEYVHL